METTEQERIVEAKQIADEFKDLPFFDPTFDFSSDQYQEMFDNHRRELEADKNATMIFDPVSKTMRNYSWCKDRYGTEMADKMLQAKRENNGMLPKEDYAELMRQQNGKEVSKTQAKEKSNSKPSATSCAFIKLDHYLLRSEKVRKALRNGMGIYLYLRMYIVRKKFAGDKLGIYESYYTKGKLAASVSIRKLSKDWSMSVNTVQKYLKEMAAAAIIKIDEIPPEKAFDNRKHNVFILGTYDCFGNENYFIEEQATIDD